MKATYIYIDKDGDIVGRAECSSGRIALDLVEDDEIVAVIVGTQDLGKINKILEGVEDIES